MSWFHWGQGNQLEFNLRIVSPLKEQGAQRGGSCFVSLGVNQIIELLANNLLTEKEMYMFMCFVTCNRR